MSELLVNKVAESGIITFNLEDYYPKDEVQVFDIKDYLFMGLILKEKDFREALKQIDFAIYQQKNVAITCSVDAVIPMWAYMLAVAYIQPYASNIVFGNADELKQQLLLKNVSTININEFADKRVVIKGCGELPITEAAYIEITKLLRPVAKSIMYGEPCSTVPIFKKK